MNMNEHPIRLVRHLDRNLKEIDRLHPKTLSILLSLTPVSTAEMTLDRAESSIVPGEYMELFTGSGSAGIFRVTQVDTGLVGSGETRVSLEHGLCTLSDRILYGHWSFGGTGKRLRSVIETLLMWQDKWKLGDCEAQTEYSYTFDHENLLSMLVQLLRPLGSGYAWIPDQTTVPWTLHLRKLPETASSELRLSRNLSGFTIREDTSELATRLYPLGSGNGGDQVTILSVNAGLPYIESDTVGTYGILESLHVESTVEDPQTLLAVSRQVLETMKEPRVTLEADGHDFSAVTGEPLDAFHLGDRCRVCFPEKETEYMERIVSLRYPDVCADPYRVTLTLRNHVNNTEDTLQRLTRKTSIQEVYARGTANESLLHFDQNADESHPAIMHFFIGEDAIHINRVMVRLTTDAFRTTTGSGTSTRVREIESMASGWTVLVDGGVVPADICSQTEWDALPYLNKGSDGKVLRNTWHSLVVQPNGICQVTAQVGIRTLIRTLQGAQA